MSYCEALAVMPNRRPIGIREFRNAHGWGPSIWSRLLTHQGHDDGYIFNSPWLDKLWQSIEDLPEWQQAPLVLTFDTGVIPCTAFGWAADMLDEFDKRLPSNPTHVNHVPAMAELLRSGLEVPILGVYGTSVSENPFESWDGVDEDDYDAEPHGISASEWYVLERHRPETAKLLAKLAPAEGANGPGPHHPV